MGLTVRELIDYLKQFPEGAEIRVITASPKTRQLFNVDGIFVITDAGCPVMCIEVGEVVHHIDGRKRNNSPENLMIFNNQSEHAKWHQEHEGGDICEVQST